MRDASNISNESNKIMTNDMNSILSNTNIVSLSSLPVMPFDRIQRLSHRTNRRNAPRGAALSDSDRRRSLVNILDDALKIVDDITNNTLVSTADMSRPIDNTFDIGSNVTVLNDITFGQSWNQLRENNHYHGRRQDTDRDNDVTNQESSHKTADANNDNFPSQ